MDREIMRRSLYTPHASTPKQSSWRNQEAMKDAFGRWRLARDLYDGEVEFARHAQARLFVDALYGRWQYQVRIGKTELSFGQWLITKETLPGSYMKLDPENVLYAFAGIVDEALTLPQYQYHGQTRVDDWLTPLIGYFINRRVVEDYFTVRVTFVTKGLANFKEAFPSLEFKEDLVPGKFAPA